MRCSVYAAPPVVKTEVFARVPDSQRAQENPRKQSGVVRDCFLEGPSFDRDGNLYVTNIPYRQIFKVSPDGEFTVVASYDGEPNGLKIHRDGRLYRLRVGGRLELLLDNVPTPNGLVLTPNKEILYLAVTRNNAVWRVPLLPDGNLGRVGIFIQLSGGMGPDGMAMDAEGNLAVCHVGMGSIWLFSRLGRPLAEIQSCAGIGTTNAAYGGSDGKALYITKSETGTILSAKLEVSGKQMYSHM